MKEKGMIEKIAKETYQLVPNNYLIKNEHYYDNNEQEMIKKACSHFTTSFSMIFFMHVPINPLPQEKFKRIYCLYDEFKRNNI